MATAAASTDRRTFLGQPIGVAYLAATEAWERFSYYGMRGLLILYMVQELLLPGRIEHVAGMGAYRAFIESVFGPLSAQAFASQTFGLYSGLVYFTPMLGGWIADRWLGARKTVMIGIAAMTLGHFMMAFDASFLAALAALIVGSGLLKGNVAAQVGHLYAPGEEADRARGYTLFSTGINVGATAGPLVCGLLAQIYGWHVGFGAAGVLMLAAAAVYAAGWKHFADDKPRGRALAAATPHPARNGPAIAIILFVIVLSMAQSLVYAQTQTMGTIWVEQQVDLSTPFGRIPVPWFSSEDAFVSILVVPVLIWLWRVTARCGVEAHDLVKMGWGGVVIALSVLMMAAGAAQAGDGGKASFAWPVLAYFFSGTAFMFQWPVVLSFVSRRAPASVNAMLMASTYLSLFVTNTAAGWFGRFYEPMGPFRFWLVQAAIALAGATALFVLAPLLRRRLETLEGADAVPLSKQEY